MTTKVVAVGHCGVQKCCSRASETRHLPFAFSPLGLHPLLTVAYPSPYSPALSAPSRRRPHRLLGAGLKVRTGRHVREAEDENFRKTLTERIEREDSLLRLKRRLHAAEVRPSTDRSLWSSKEAQQQRKQKYKMKQTCSRDLSRQKRLFESKTRTVLPLYVHDMMSTLLGNWQTSRPPGT